VVLLLPGEQTISRVLATEVDRTGSHPGYLTLTNLRLTFEGQVHGRMTTLLDIRLGYVYNVHIDRSLLGKSLLRVEALGISHEYRGVDAAQWATMIATAKSAAPVLPVPPPRPATSPTAAPSNSGQIVVNVQAPASPGPTVFLHCRHCGSLMPAGHVHCTNCGATL